MSDAVSASRRSSFTLEDNARMPFHEAYRLFVHAGFMPEDKARLVASHRAEIEHTFETLGRHAPLVNSVTARDDLGSSVGYLSAVWCYRRTTMFQHLSGLPGFHTGGAMVVNLMDRTVDDPQFDYMKFYFLADNPYPARLYGSFGETASDGRTCTMRTVAHVVTSVDAVITPHDPRIRVREASGQDLEWIEDYFLDREIALVRRAEDLSAEELHVESLNRRYQRVGLFRHRHVLLAFKDFEVLGLALVELSSPGLNLSEGLSAFRIHLTDAAAAVEDAVRATLVRAAQDIYRRAGRHVVLGLVDAEESDAYARLGLSVPATSRCILMHRSRFNDFATHVGRRTRTRRRALAEVCS